MISGSSASRKTTIGKTASGALLDEKGPHGGGHENETVAKLEDPLRGLQHRRTEKKGEPLCRDSP